MSSEPLDLLLKQCLAKLNHTDNFNENIEYLHSEWLNTIEDLKLVSMDEQAWLNLRLPARLKIELLKLLKEIDVEPTPKKPPQTSRDTNHEEEHTNYTENYESTSHPYNEWVLYYSVEHECYYYYNTVTFESSWECPDETLHYEYQEQEWTEEQLAEFAAQNVVYNQEEQEDSENVNDEGWTGIHSPGSVFSGTPGLKMKGDFSPNGIRAPFSRPRTAMGTGSSIFQDSPAAKGWA